MNLPTQMGTFQVPAHIIRRQQQGGSALTAALSTSDASAQPNRLSIRGGTFRVINEGTEHEGGRELHVVIVGANPRLSKQYYANPYDPTAQVTAPDCWSADGIKPNISIASPINLSLIHI